MPRPTMVKSCGSMRREAGGPKIRARLEEAGELLTFDCEIAVLGTIGTASTDDVVAVLFSWGRNCEDDEFVEPAREGGRPEKLSDPLEAGMIAMKST